MDKEPRPPDTANVWDVLAALKPLPASTPPLTRHRLPLRPEARREHLPHLPRSVTGIDPGLRATLRSLIAGEESWPLFLWGPAGVGKTAAALSVLDHVKQGSDYFTAASLASTIIQAQQGRLFWGDRCVNPEDFWAAMGRQRLGHDPGYVARALVVLDELGCRGQVSDHHFEAVKTMLDARHGLPLIVCSNLSLTDVASTYDDRISSRLAAGTVFRLGGDDRRLLRGGSPN